MWAVGPKNLKSPGQKRPKIKLINFTNYFLCSISHKNSSFTFKKWTKISGYFYFFWLTFVESL